MEGCWAAVGTVGTHYMVNTHVDTESNFYILLPGFSWFIVGGEMTAPTSQWSLIRPWPQWTLVKKTSNKLSSLPLFPEEYVFLTYATGVLVLALHCVSLWCHMFHKIGRYHPNIVCERGSVLWHMSDFSCERRLCLWFAKSLEAICIRKIEQIQNKYRMS